ncbi:MAG: PAS domain S-box protein [Planctomycetaceae bacterium]|nr:PAS domain S-box protein [Planctomycetaceae bacterium]
MSQSESTLTFLQKLFDTGGFHSRWNTNAWDLQLGWLHIFSDVAIFCAFVAIPIGIANFLFRRRDFGVPSVMWLFVAFILACGITHLCEAATFWYPAYRFAGLWKLTTAVLSWATVVALVRLGPRFLALPDARELMELLQHEQAERVLIESHLQQKRALLSNIVENAPCGIYWTSINDDEDSQGERHSDHAEPVFEEREATAEDSLNCQLTVEGFRKEDLEALKSGQVETNEERVLYVDGQPRVMLCNRFPVRDDDGQIFGVLGILSDITDRIEQEKALRESEHRFRATFEQAAMGIAHVGVDGTWLKVNHKLCEILGYSSAELAKMTFQDVTHPDDLDEDLRLVQRVINNDITDYSVEKRYIRKSGDVVWVNLTVSLLRNDDGTPNHFVSVVEDITERKRVAEQVLIAQRQANEANRAKSDFLAHMSHEIRTPLNGILGFAELLKRGVGTPSQQRSHIQTILSSGRHLLTLIDDVLDLSKIETGNFQLAREPVSPHQIISEVMSILRVRAQEKCVSLEAEWMTATPEFIHTDAARLRQILMNVVGNAIKFTEEGQVRVRASIDQDSPEPRFVVEVSDTGIGIPPDRLQAIFEPFCQADSSITRRFGGTGLGMTISRKIARELGGEITVSSEVGLGSTFRISVSTGPLEGVEMSVSPRSEALHDSHATFQLPSTSLSGIRVLLAEDGQANRELIQLLLEDADAEVTVVVNGRDAVNAVRSRPFDVVLMDMQMPILDGYSATRRIREDGQELPIIALTAHAMRGDADKCFEAGCSGYLTKPIDLTELLVAIFQAAESSSRKSPPSSRETASWEDSAVEVALKEIRSTLPVHQPAISRIVSAFVQQLFEKLDEMQEALRHQDDNRLGELAHWLKGSGGTMGFACFTKPAQKLMEQCHHDSPADRGQIEDIVDHIAELASAIRAPDEAASENLIENAST